MVSQTIMLTVAGREQAVQRACRVLGALPADKAWKVTVEAWKGSRSIPQNKLLWSLYEDILRLGGPDMQGWDKQDLHAFFKIEMFGSEVREVFGRKRHVPLKGTSGLTKPEMSDFIDGVVRFMAERGVVLELPGE